MSSDSPVAVVTGAYRGLGYETARRLAEQGLRVVLTARREAEGRAAADALAGQGLAVAFYPLDVTEEASIQALAAHVRDTYARLDVLVNNAGILPDRPQGWGEGGFFSAELDTVRRALETNTLGPMRLAQVLIPLMQGRGRVVNVSSGMGQLAEMGGGFPAYRLSKTALNAVTRMLAAELKDTGVKVNAVCPGWVRTDMGGPEATLSVEEGAEGILWAATLPDDGPSGGFFRHGQPIAW